MTKQPQQFAILVCEYGSDKEVELCRVASNPAAIVDAAKMKMLNVLSKESKKRIQTPRYGSVRYIAVSIAIAIIQLTSLGCLSAATRTASVEQCRTQGQVRSSYPTKHLAYRIAGGKRCWFPVAPASNARRSRAVARPNARPANLSEQVTLPVSEQTGARPTTFNERWILR